MNLGLEGKTAWVGGSSKGLGRACAEALAKEGAKVIISSRNVSELEIAVQEMTSLGFDVAGVPINLSSQPTVSEGISQIVEDFGGVDIAVINSGGPVAGKFMELSDSEWDDWYYGSLGYVRDVCRILLPRMAKKKWGRIITITSIVASEPESSLTLSSVYRGGVLNLVKILSSDFAMDGVTVNNVSPGAFKTDRAIQLMKDRSSRTGESLKEIEADSTSNLPMGKYQSPEECGNVVAFLSSELSSGITGVNLRIDGGIAKGI
jgi:3-oxoacyl-[acyl-carrier protein] reductase